MKKIILTLVATFMVATSASAFSFDWGITGGLNYTKVKISNKSAAFASLKSGDSQAGWNIGVRANVGLIAGIGINGALLYNQNKLVIENDMIRETETERSFSIPLNLRYNFGIGKTGVFVGTGPQFDFALGSTKWNKALGQAADTFDKNNMSTSWNISAGAKILGKVELTAGYTFALGSIGKALVGNALGSGIVGGAADIKRNMFQVNATYYF
ncbi:MAG: PorT family protein [Bacteroidaceae bacterium]|nr:PorT family protein [Bacteroidaceae bacterium]